MGIDLSSGGGLAGPEEPVKGPGIHLVAIRIVPVALSVNGKFHGNDRELQIANQLSGEIARGIGYNTVTHSVPPNDKNSDTILIL